MCGLINIQGACDKVRLTQRVYIFAGVKAICVVELGVEWHQGIEVLTCCVCLGGCPVPQYLALAICYSNTKQPEHESVVDLAT
jgi:hypothetical protein